MSMVWAFFKMIREAGTIVVIYLTFSFLLPMLLFPNHIFKTRIQKTEKLRKFAARFKEKDKEKTLKNIYNFVAGNYSSERHNLFLLLWKHFYTDVEKLTEKKQFLPCHVQNLILVTLLMNTGQFKEKEIERKETITVFGAAHQYLFVKINGKKLKIDPFFDIWKEL